MLLEICRLKVAEVFAFLVVLGILGGDAYLVDVGIVITHLVVEHHQESAHLQAQEARNLVHSTFVIFTGVPTA